jgi:hypothetical protein
MIRRKRTSKVELKMPRKKRRRKRRIRRKRKQLKRLLVIRTKKREAIKREITSMTCIPRPRPMKFLGAWELGRHLQSTNILTISS